MRKGPKVSIIMPSLNVVNYIEECLQSVLSQTLKEIEILCIDAGSTDGTREFIDKYSAEDKRIRVIDSVKKSYGYQVNIGIQKAEGEYIAILETDDYVDCEMYERLYLSGKKNDADYVRADYDEIYEINSYRLYNTKHILKEAKQYGKLVKEEEINKLFFIDQNIWGGIYKKTFLERYHIWLSETPGAAFQDIGFKLQTLIHCKKILYINYSGYRYRVERDGCSSCNNNVLKFAWQEFDRLFNKVDLQGQNRFKYVVLRMIDIFICEYNKLVIKLSIEKQVEFYEEYIESYYKWFKEKITEYYSDRVITDCDIAKCESKNLMLLLEHKKKYNKDIMKSYERNKNYWDELAKKLSNLQVVIVSCGIRGKAALKELVTRNVNVVAVCDNNQEVVKQNIGIPLLFVEDAIQQYKNAIYIISNKKFSEVLNKQLILNGVLESNIIQVLS